LTPERRCKQSHRGAIKPLVGVVDWKAHATSFPAHSIANHVGLSTNIVEFRLPSWRRTDEHTPLAHIAEVAHVRGLIWDSISIERSGGPDLLVVTRLPKGQARYFAEQVRGRLNEAVLRRRRKFAVELEPLLAG